jgi:hypothetical protein
MKKNATQTLPKHWPPWYANVTFDACGQQFSDFRTFINWTNLL